METAATLFTQPCVQNAWLFLTNTGEERTCGFFTQMDFLGPASQSLFERAQVAVCSTNWKFSDEKMSRGGWGTYLWGIIKRKKTILYSSNT